MNIKSALIATAVLACSLASPAAGLLTPDIDSEVIYLDDSYQEFGRWTFYCDGTSTITGQTSYRAWHYYYGCPS